jgi:hypothetical protein
MPFYDWRDKKTQQVLSVFRTSLTEYDVPPTPEEIAEAKLVFGDEKPEWERIIGGIKIIRPYGFTFRGNN